MYVYVVGIRVRVLWYNLSENFFFRTFFKKIYNVVRAPRHIWSLSQNDIISTLNHYHHYYYYLRIGDYKK